MDGDRHVDARRNQAAAQALRQAGRGGVADAAFDAEVADVTDAILTTLRRTPSGLGLRSLRRTAVLRKQTVCAALRELVEAGAVIQHQRVLLGRDGRWRGIPVYRLVHAHLHLSPHRCQPGSAQASRLFVPGPPSPMRHSGGKWKLLKEIAPLLVPALAKAEVFAEPYVGGGSVALWVAQNYPKLPIILNDRDPEVAALWRVLVGDEHEALAEMVRRRRPTRKFFGELTNGAASVDRHLTFRRIMFSRLAYDGRIDGGWSENRRVRFDGADLARRIRRIHNLLAGRTTVFNEDALDLIQRLPAKTVIYADPPYPTQGPKLYRHAMSEGEHEALADALRRRRGPWLVSNEYARSIRELYAAREIRTVANRGKRELLILSPDLARLNHGQGGMGALATEIALRPGQPVEEE